MISPVELLQQLVRIPSVNPDGNPGTSETGEKKCAEFLAGYLRECNAEVSLQEVFPDRPNVVARFPSRSGKKPRLLFAPHTDTVSVEGMTIDPFSGESRDGRIWGRGSSDTKGPMAAMLVALKNLGDGIADLSHEIWFAGLVGEEAGQHGAKALATSEKFDFVIVGEPTEMNVVHAHKGSAWLTLRTHGRAVHSSQPERGDNAIYKMARAVTFLQEKIIPQLQSQEDPILGNPTMSVGTIRGGSKVNIVPDFCETLVDMRTIPGQDVQQVIDALIKQVPGIEIEKIQSLPLFTDPQHPVIRQLCAMGSLATGASWFCDAAVFAGRGTPAVAMGPGSIKQAHTADEFIDISALENGAEFFTKFLQNLK